MSTETKIVTIRARAFSAEGIRTHRVMVESDGSVLVWDAVAGYYTSCHSLSASAIRRARKMTA